jgi:ribonuclease P protein component
VSAATPEDRPPASRARFRKSMRLLRHSDFERVYKQGRRHFASRMTVFFRLREGSGGPRIGFTVSKALGGAVERNRMRRRLREAVRLGWPAFSAPVDIVVNPKKSVLTASFQQIAAEIGNAFEVVRKFAEKPSSRGPASSSV